MWIWLLLLWWWWWWYCGISVLLLVGWLVGRVLIVAGFWLGLVVAWLEYWNVKHWYLCFTSYECSRCMPCCDTYDALIYHLKKWIMWWIIGYWPCVVWNGCCICVMVDLCVCQSASPVIVCLVTSNSDLLQLEVKFSAQLFFALNSYWIEEDIIFLVPCLNWIWNLCVFLFLFFWSVGFGVSA